MIQLGYLTLYPVQIESLANRYIIYRFNISKQGKYISYLDNNQLNKFFKLPSELKIQVDNNVFSKTYILEDNFLNLGEIFFTEGIHEIIISYPEEVNLIERNNLIELNSDANSEIKLSVSPFDPFSSYVISYDYWIRKGGVFHLIVSHDNDVNISSENHRNYAKSYSNDKYIHDFMHDQIYISPKGGASKLDIGFKVDAYNDCKKEINVFSQDCSVKDYKKLFDKETSIVIKNLSINKVFNNDLRLMQTISDKKIRVPNIKFTKLDPTEYKIKISNASQPYILVFSELFNSGWKLKKKDGNFIDDKSHILVNSYANGWQIDAIGDYDLVLKFIPQDFMEIGELISVTTAVIVSLLTIWFIKKRI